MITRLKIWQLTRTTILKYIKKKFVKKSKKFLTTRVLSVIMFKTVYAKLLMIPLRIKVLSDFSALSGVS